MELIDTMLKKTTNFIKGRHVLGIQDTTELNYQAHVNRVRGLGTVGNGTDAGLFLHPMLVVDAQEGTCLGIAGIKQWLRTEAAQKEYPKQPIEEKESYRWLETAQKSQEILSEADQVTIIADRESDIYEEWCRIPNRHTHLLTRACRDRKLSNKWRLFDYVSQLEVKGIYEIKVPERIGKRSAHTARLEIRYDEIVILKPRKCSDKTAPKKIQLRVIDVRELSETVIGKEAPIHWCLLTTHVIESEEDALQIVNWYCQRWNIEQLFRTLKRQGLDIESSQVETGEGLLKLSLLALNAALQIMQLTLSRKGKDQDIAIIFTEKECRILSAVQKRLEGKTEKQKNPYCSKQLSWAAWIIARLGGWKGYASESPPGPITMSRGLRQFKTLFDGWQLAEMCA